MSAFPPWRRCSLKAFQYYTFKVAFCVKTLNSPRITDCSQRQLSMYFKWKGHRATSCQRLWNDWPEGFAGGFPAKCMAENLQH